MDLRELREEPVRRHPWETARARFFIRLLRRHGLLMAPIPLLDVGAGDGYLAQQLLGSLPAGAAAICFDPNYSDAHLAAFNQRSDHTIEFVRARPAKRFGLVLLLDVLEHVPDDRRFLESLVDDALAPGGTLLVSVPAWMSLFTDHDRKLGHHRRYRPGQLAQVMTAAGVRLFDRGGLFHSLMVPRALEKLRERVRGVQTAPYTLDAVGPCETDLTHWNHGRFVTSAIDLALAIDNSFSSFCARAGLQMPGLSTWALGRKPI